ncbi:MAG: caspase family protein [Lewinellaceae bacterium]|nr:caspase family protein [Lewinellaceae bacterium]
MKQQPFFLSSLLVVHSFNLIAQPNKYEGLFGRSRDQTHEIRRESNYRDSPNGDVNIYAVVVGVGEYTAMPPLRYTSDDARLFYTHLQSEQGGALPENQIVLLLEQDATHRNVSQALRLMSQRADANDVIIFYFSGHGLSQSFLPIDFDGFRNQLGHNDVFRILQKSRAQHKLCIADACHSGGLDYTADLASKGYVSSATSTIYQEYSQAHSGIALLMSSSAGEASLEDRSLRQGVFTHFLLRGMSGTADYNFDGIVNIKELFHYVSHKVKEYTYGAQSPWLTGDYDDDMPVSIGE